MTDETTARGRKTDATDQPIHQRRVQR